MSKRILLGFMVELICFCVVVVLSRQLEVVVLMLAGTALAIGLSLEVSRSIAVNAREMAAAARGLAEGDVNQTVGLRSDDDLGQIAEAFRAMIAYQQEMADVANALAHGDLSAEIAPKSDRDVLGSAFARMRTGVRQLVGQLERQALHDELTGLPNRALLMDRLAHVLHARRRSGTPLALVVMDLDHFKEVNDVLGHQVGDMLLRAVATRLRTVVRASDTLARFGGDEFVVLLPDTNAMAAARVVERLVHTMDESFELEGRLIGSQLSVGVALCPDHGEKAETLLRRADIAMYEAKRSQRGHAVFTAEGDANAAARLAMVAELRGAVPNGELRLHYQPQLQCAAGEIRCVEALVRWESPLGGLIEPADFIHVAESTGLIQSITEWVLATAIRQCAQWMSDGLELAVSVNISARNLQDSWLVGMVTQTLAESGVPPGSLVLEVTESALMSDPAAALDALAALNRCGVGISIDDYGTGYSTLAYLKQVPAHELKIDETFVRGLKHDQGDAAIVSCTITLAHELGLRVVAEGVEDAETLDILVGMGCDLAQGNYLSRPLPAAELALWLQTAPWPAPRAATRDAEPSSAG